MNKTQQIRELARRVSEVAHSPRNYNRRVMWSRHNDMEWDGPPPIQFSLGTKTLREILPTDCLGAVDPVYRLVETQLHTKLWYAGLGDDHVIEPWVDMTATYYDDAITMWGVEAQFSEFPNGTAFNGEIEEPEDVYRLHVPIPHMDGTRTLEQYDRARELLDGILGVRMDWRHRHLVYPNFGVWVVRFMGLEKFMLWCASNPAEINFFMNVMSVTYIQHAIDMERRQRLTDNHCLLSDMFPFHGDVAGEPVRLNDMWVHSDSQEFTLISPEMTWRYLLKYNFPIFEMFGRGSFGCCESLDRKLSMVRTLPNLRRVTISERTNWEKAINELRGDFVYVVRPSMVDNFYAGNETTVRKGLEKMRDTFRGLHWECNCPGPEEFIGDTQRYHKWCAIAKDVLQKGTE